MTDGWSPPGGARSAGAAVSQRPRSPASARGSGEGGAAAECMVKVGMPEMDALIAATRTSADLCELAGDLGTIEAGKLADLAVLGSDPLADISAVRDVRLVMKDGRLVNLGPNEGVEDFFDLYF